MESKDRAECKQYASRFAEDPGRMKDACLISRGHRQIYSTILGELKACFPNCMTPRGYAVSVY